MKKHKIKRSVLRNYIITYFLVFSVPLVIFSFIIYYQTTRKFSQEHIATAQTAADGVLGNLVRLYDLSAANANFVRENQYYSDSYIRDFAGSFIYIDKNMRNLDGINKDFSQLGFYSTQSDLIYTTSIYNRPFYFTHIFISSLLNEQMNLSEISSARWLPMHKVIFEEKEVVMSTIIHPLQRSLKNGKPFTHSLFFLHLDMDKMSQLLSPVSAIPGAHAIVFWDGVPLFSDDYDFMQNYISQQVEVTHDTTIDIGEETYHALETAMQQHISFVSFLPQKNIKRLASDIMLMYILSLTLSVVVAAILIFFSVRYNYRPILKLLRKVASEIVLPDEVERLDEVDRTVYAVDNLLENKKQIEVDNRQYKTNHLILRLLENSEAYTKQDVFETRCMELSLRFHSRYYCCAIFIGCNNREDFIFYLHNLSELHSLHVFAASDLDESTTMALLCSEDNTDTILKQLLELTKHMFQAVGIGCFIENIAHVSISYKEAYHALLHTTPNETVYFYTDTKKVDKADILTQFSKESDLFSNSIMQQQQNQMRLSLSHIADLLNMIAQDSSIPVLLHHIQFIAVKSLAAANLPFASIMDIFSNFSLKDEIPNINDWLTAFTTHLVYILDSAKGSNIVTEESTRIRMDTANSMQYILIYINSSYMKMDFSIKALADELGMSVSNLSHFFKNRQGQNISDYICALRMTEAKRLLVETDLLISDLVPLLGYSHISSFTKTFKKITGMTPSEYKSSHSSIPVKK